MTPERFNEIRNNKICDMGPLSNDVRELRESYREVSSQRAELIKYIEELLEDTA